jgi:hypothetical protein
MPTLRRAGERDPRVDKDPIISIRELLRPIPQFFRLDFGGRNQSQVIANRLTDAGLIANNDTIAAYKLGANQAKDGIQSRVMPRIRHMLKMT